MVKRIKKLVHRVTKGSVERNEIGKAVFVTAEKVPSKYKNKFYTTNAAAEVDLISKFPEGDVYKVVVNDARAKIVARINEKLYNFPAVVTAPGSKDKVRQAYLELFTPMEDQ